MIDSSRRAIQILTSEHRWPGVQLSGQFEFIENTDQESNRNDRILGIVGILGVGALTLLLYVELLDL